MKKIILLSLIILFVVPVLLQSSVTYLDEDSYKKLKKKARLEYWENLESNLAELQQRKSDAIINSDKYEKEIEELKAKLNKTNAEYDEVYKSILTMLNIGDYDEGSIRGKIAYFNSKIDGWNNLSDDEIWKAKKNINELIVEFQEYKKLNYGKLPDFRKDFSDLDNRIKNLGETVGSAKPKYYEDSYSVKKNDTLSKISGYSFIYNNPKKWGIIYRANRDQISDPNIVSVNQVLKIPRGLPNSWKVYKGEFLWKIASYPEIYGKGSKWPLIYRANQDKIKDPNLIYPNQILQIPRD